MTHTDNTTSIIEDNRFAGIPDILRTGVDQDIAWPDDPIVGVLIVAIGIMDIKWMIIHNPD